MAVTITSIKPVDESTAQMTLVVDVPLTMLQKSVAGKAKKRDRADFRARLLAHLKGLK